jgi:prolycopene isomerase
VGIRGDAAALGFPDRTRFVLPTYDFDVEEKALAENDPRSQSYMLGNHDLADPGHAPAGRSILHAAMIADGRHWMSLDESTYRERKREVESLLIDRIAESIPDVRERIEIVETGTPRTMQRYSWNPNGAIYRPNNSPTAHSIHRPAPRSPVPGLYLAGAWTFPGGGFGGAMSSGWHTASLVMQDVEGSPPT